MANPSNAGPYEVGLDGALGAGETEVIELSEVRAGPADKLGYLRKVFGAPGGMDYVFIVNESSELITVAAKSGNSFIPPATSQTLDSGPYRSVKLTNSGDGTINDGNNNRVAVMVGNVDRATGQPEPAFSVRRAINDAVPGLRL